MRILEDKDDVLALLQRDKDFYEGQDKKMRMKINTLGRQLDEIQNEAHKCKYLWIFLYMMIDKKLLEEINNNRLRP